MLLYSGKVDCSCEPPPPCTCEHTQPDCACAKPPPAPEPEPVEECTQHPCAPLKPSHEDVDVVSIVKPANVSQVGAPGSDWGEFFYRPPIPKIQQNEVFFGKISTCTMVEENFLI